MPIPDALSQAVHQAAPAANYPIKAEARSGSAPDSKFDAGPGSTLTAHADANRVEGLGAVQGADLPGVATYGSTYPPAPACNYGYRWYNGACYPIR